MHEAGHPDLVGGRYEPKEAFGERTKAPVVARSVPGHVDDEVHTPKKRCPVGDRRDVGAHELDARGRLLRGGEAVQRDDMPVVTELGPEMSTN